jgi:ABC-2 type transport system ATP-binding protein
MTETIISVKNLVKTYQTFKKQPGLAGAIKSFFIREPVSIHAIKATSFEIKRGEFIGLLGPNGAGKTTMLKMMTGLIPPTSGTSTTFGRFDTSRRPRAYLRKIGMVMGQRNQLHPDLPALDSFRLSQAIYDIPQKQFEARLNRCLDLFEIHSKLNIPVRKLSLGERMKMELILAILHEPEILFLDEPTIGLDFSAARQIRTFLAEANSKFKITIVLTSHYTKDIEELCRRVILINHGTLIYDGPLDGVDERVQGERQVVVTASDTKSQAEILHVIKSLDGVTTVNGAAVDQKTELPGTEPADDLTITFAVPARLVGETTKKLLNTLTASDIRDLTISERSIEDVFAEIYNRPEGSPSPNLTSSATGGSR